MPIPTKYQGANYGVSYSDEEARQAIANAEIAQIVSGDDPPPSSTSVAVTNFPAIQPVSGTVTFSNTSIGVSSLPSLPAGSNIIGAISNISFGISGTLPAFTSTPTFNIGASGGIALDTTLTGGTQKAIARGGAKGATAAADVTSTSVDANTQALDVSVKGTLAATVNAIYNSTLPALTNGQSAPLQLSQRGALYIDTIDFVSTPVNISVADTNTTTSTGQDNQTLIRGNPTNNSFASFSCSGNSSFALLIENQPAGTPFVGTLQIERSLDPNGTIWTPVGAFVAGSAFTRSQITAEAALHGNCSSSLNLRVRAIAFTSGTARITFLAGHGTGTITIGNGIRLFDNTSGAFAAIKAAATAALASDPAIVVVQRPSVAATILSLQTNANGATFNSFSSQVCSYLKIQNITGVDIELRRGGAGNTWRILNNTVEVVPCTGNASEIGIRRFDQSNTQVTITADAIAL